MSKPMSFAVPLLGVNAVERILKSVVLPPPFGPSSAKISPRRTSKLTPSSARRGVLWPRRAGYSWTMLDAWTAFEVLNLRLVHHHQCKKRRQIEYRNLQQP